MGSTRFAARSSSWTNVFDPSTSRAASHAKLFQDAKSSCLKCLFSELFREETRSPVHKIINNYYITIIYICIIIYTYKRWLTDFDVRLKCRKCPQEIPQCRRGRNRPKCSIQTKGHVLCTAHVSKCHVLL